MINISRSFQDQKIPDDLMNTITGPHSSRSFVIRLDTRAQCVFPSCRRSLSRTTSTKYGALTWSDGRMTLWTINNETRIIEAHKPIAKLSSRCRTRVEIAHRVALVPRATNRARFCVNMGERLADNRLKELLISDFNRILRCAIFLFRYF